MLEIKNKPNYFMFILLQKGPAKTIVLADLLLNIFFRKLNESYTKLNPLIVCSVSVIIPAIICFAGFI